MRLAQGELLLFADADGASDFGDLCLLEDAIGKKSSNRGIGIAVGSRAHLVDGEAAVKVPSSSLCLSIFISSILSKFCQADSLHFNNCTTLHFPHLVLKRTFLRNVLMHGFHLWLWLFGVKHIKDTQCGFKLFTRRSAQQIFPYMHMQGWVFDVEVLLLAHYQKIKVLEVSIRWQEIDGSKLNLAQDAIKMARDVVLIRANYMTGIWKVPVQ